MAEIEATKPTTQRAAPAAPADLPRYTSNAVQTVRTVQHMALQLSQMADQKASILMGATFLVFSISVSRSLAGDLPVALVVLAVFAFLSSLCAVFAVIPSVGAPPRGITPNLLFFGHFTHMDEDDWTDQVLESLKHDDTMFRAMLHDVYQNGQVLQRKKYRFLSLAYKIFIIGLFSTLATFAVELSMTY